VSPPLSARLVGALPHAIVTVYFAQAFVGFIARGQELTPGFRDLSGWVAYELLAVLYASVLPLGMVAAGILQAFGLALGRSRVAERVGTVLLAVPFAWIAWRLAPALGGWAVLGAFAVLAAGRWMTYHTRGGALVQDGVAAIFLCGREAVRVWTLATASFLLAGFFVVPLEPILGFDMPSIDHGQHYLLVGMGMIYFLLNTLADVLPVGRWLETLRRRQAARLLASASRPRPQAP
jgi:hypothetical protein